ncbi:YoaP domain-containing protein [Paenibacillus dokdonensis]|uniref:YoaP domain-containing protein n=1 Tax=Paenibacillus dokdonensis TaxID=2567944 RepID=A0ABU6GKR8_9BACL|nr:GNAT family N-acetyltransferase [Paenibacillus dokdonensis]MEC0240315.1 YoaP domain-containing protein [Paenibacillus dokdonensis]
MINIVEVNNENIEEKGFFCMRSKPKSRGYQNKLSWLKERLEEGLKLKILEENGYPRGFIEYVPSEYTWRGITGNNYIVIHCLWIVGKGKDKGYGTKLLHSCLDDAMLKNKSGVAMVTSSETWLAEKSFFMKHGFESIDQAPPSFELIVKRFNNDPVPQFNHGWEERSKQYKDGITIIRANQCPYFEEAVKTIVEVANERGIKTNIILLENHKEAQNAPSAYGVFNVIFNGSFLTYHPLSKRELIKKLDLLQV